MNTAHSGAAAPGVVVTRPAAQAGALADALARQGFDPVLFGALEIVPLDPLPPPPDRFDCAVFISRNAVECGSAVVLGNPPAGGPLVAAIGEGTANALRERGVDLPPLPTLCVVIDEFRQTYPTELDGRLKGQFDALSKMVTCH